MNGTVLIRVIIISPVATSRLAGGLSVQSQDEATVCDVEKSSAASR